jgi:Ni/Fe-hydrogenase subunit HybB-like protein
VAWTALFLAISVVGLSTSDGPPVCEGPFITRVDDSLPPQCPSPVEFLPAVGLVWVVGLAVIIGVRALVRSTSPDRALHQRRGGG